MRVVTSLLTVVLPWICAAFPRQQWGGSVNNAGVYIPELGMTYNRGLLTDPAPKLPPLPPRNNANPGYYKPSMPSWKHIKPLPRRRMVVRPRKVNALATAKRPVIARNLDPVIGGSVQYIQARAKPKPEPANAVISRLGMNPTPRRINSPSSLISNYNNFMPYVKTPVGLNRKRVNVNINPVNQNLIPDIPPVPPGSSIPPEPITVSPPTDLNFLNPQGSLGTSQTVAMNTFGQGNPRTFGLPRNINNIVNSYPLPNMLSHPGVINNNKFSNNPVTLNNNGLIPNQFPKLQMPVNLNIIKPPVLNQPQTKQIIPIVQTVNKITKPHIQPIMTKIKPIINNAPSKFVTGLSNPRPPIAKPGAQMTPNAGPMPLPRFNPAQPYRPNPNYMFPRGYPGSYKPIPPNNIKPISPQRSGKNVKRLPKTPSPLQSKPFLSTNNFPPPKQIYAYPPFVMNPRIFAQMYGVPMSNASAIMPPLPMPKIPISYPINPNVQPPLPNVLPIPKVPPMPNVLPIPKVPPLPNTASAASGIWQQFRPNQPPIAPIPNLAHTTTTIATTSARIPTTTSSSATPARPAPPAPSAHAPPHDPYYHWSFYDWGFADPYAQPPYGPPPMVHQRSHVIPMSVSVPVPSNPAPPSPNPPLNPPIVDPPFPNPPASNPSPASHPPANLPLPQPPPAQPVPHQPSPVSHQPSPYSPPITPIIFPQTPPHVATTTADPLAFLRVDPHYTTISLSSHLTHSTNPATSIIPNQTNRTTLPSVTNTTMIVLNQTTTTIATTPGPWTGPSTMSPRQRAHYMHMKRTLLKPPFLPKNYEKICEHLNRTQVNRTSHAFGPIKNDCGAYVKCDIYHGFYFPNETTCNFGLWFDTGTHSCVDADAISKPCQHNPCSKLARGQQVNIPYPGSCSGFLTCEGGSATAEICESGVNFDPLTGLCCVPPAYCPCAATMGAGVTPDYHLQNFIRNFGQFFLQGPPVERSAGKVDMALTKVDLPNSILGSCQTTRCPRDHFLDHVQCRCVKR